MAEKQKILILGVAAVQCDAVITCKEMGMEVHAIAKANDGPASQYADYFEPINFLDKEQVIQYIEKHQIDVVYSVGSDMAMPIASWVSEQLGLPHFVSSEAATICNRKDELRNFLGNSFAGNIQFQILEQQDEQINLEYPFIMKPVDSQGQRGVRLIKNEDEFRKTFEMSKNYSRTGKVILEKYIDGPEISVNAYFIDGQLVFLIPSDRNCWTQFEGGLVREHVVPSRAVNDGMLDKLFSLVSRTAEKLSVKNGPLYFQIKLKGDEPKIIEATPRLDGCHMWRLLSYYTSFNLLKLTMEHLTGRLKSPITPVFRGHGSFKLEFFCEMPNAVVQQEKFLIPEHLCQHWYYENGAKVRPVNNQYEKIGYFIAPN